MLSKGNGQPDFKSFINPLGGIQLAGVLHKDSMNIKISSGQQETTMS